MDSDKLIERIMDTLTKMDDKISHMSTAVTEMRAQITQQDHAIADMRTQLDGIRVTSQSLVRMTVIVVVGAVCIAGVRFDAAFALLKKLVSA